MNGQNRVVLISMNGLWDCVFGLPRIIWISSHTQKKGSFMEEKFWGCKKFNTRRKEILKIIASKWNEMKSQTKKNRKFKKSFYQNSIKFYI